MSQDTMTAEARALHAVLADDLEDAARILVVESHHDERVAAEEAG